MNLDINFLEKSLMQWRFTFDAISSPLAVITHERNIIKANKAFKDIVHKEWTEIINANIDSLLKDRIELTETFYGFQGIESLNKPHITLINDKWYTIKQEAVSQSVNGADDKVIYFEDVTDTIVLERELKESERRYFNFFEKVSIGIIYVDANTRIKDINTRACMIMGVDKFHAVSERLENIGLSSIGKRVETMQILQDSSSSQGTYSILRLNDSKKIWISATIQPIIHEDSNQIQYYLLVFEDISERKRIREDLLSSEIRYNQLLDIAPIGILVISDNRIRFMNKTASNILRAPDEISIRGSSYNDLNPSMNEINRLSEETIETNFKRFDGSVVDIELSKTSMRYRNKSSDLVVFTDISQRKQSERIRANTEAQLKAVFESAPLIVQIVDRDFSIRELNPVGYVVDENKRTPCESKNNHCAHLKEGLNVHKKNCRLCHLRSAVMSTLHSGLDIHNREIEMKVIRNGATVNVTYLLHASRIFQETEPLCLLVLNDITDFKHTQETLSRTIIALKIAKTRNQRHSRWINALYGISRALTKTNDSKAMMNTAFLFLEKHFNFSAACVIFSDSDGQFNTVQAISKRGKDINSRLGVTPGAIFDTSYLPRFFNVKDSEKVDTFQVLADTSEYEEGYWSSFKDSLLAEGLICFAKIPFIVEKTKHGLFLLAYDVEIKLNRDEKTFLTDLADLIGMAMSNFKLYKELRDSYIKLEQALKNLEKQRRLQAMGQIASGITHDINNTLVPLKLYTEALLDREPGLSEKAIKYLTLIKKATGDIEHVTSRLRSFYKGSEYTELEPVDIENVLNDVSDITRPKWKDAVNKNGIHIEFKVITDQNIKPISANTSEFREALINLVFNAVDAMPNGGSLTLSAHAETDYVEINVSDTGTGMTTEVLEKCMEPFFTTKGPKGTGLGLAEVYGTIRRFGGEILIDTIIKRGTTIRLRLPYYQSIALSIDKNTSQSHPKHVYSVILVDDDQRILEVLKEILTLDGHMVTPFDSAKNALRYLRSSHHEHFDLIITDLGMPVMDGKEFVLRIKSTFPNIPVIMLTGWGKILEREPILANVDKLLSKPVDIDTLRDAMNEVMHNYYNKGVRNERNDINY